MLNVASELFGGGHGLRTRAMSILAMVAAFNIVAWGFAIMMFHGNAVLLGTAFLAFSLGLRHAVDADHIAAIDNVTRKLMQEGKRSVSIGLFFSLGHSTIVVGLSLMLIASAAGLRDRLGMLEEFGGIFGALLSSVFLLALAAMNFAVLCSVVRAFRHVRRGGRYEEGDLSLPLVRGGLARRLFSRLFAMVNRSWYMYPVGLLFGLGFDTATEIGLLSISAAGSSRGLDTWTIMVFPALFTAGMTLIDTADNVLMVGAYNWSFAKPLRKLYYNITITAISVMVAVLVGGIEVLALLQSQWNLSGWFWDGIGAIGGNFGLLGFGIVLVFALSWATSMAVYKLRRYDESVIKSAD